MSDFAIKIREYKGADQSSYWFLDLLGRGAVELVLSTRYAISSARGTALEHTGSLDE